MIKYIAATVALIAGILMAYFGLGTYINKYFKGRKLDILIVIILVALIITVVGIGLKIANHYFAIFLK